MSCTILALLLHVAVALRMQAGRPDSTGAWTAPKHIRTTSASSGTPISNEIWKPLKYSWRVDAKGLNLVSFAHPGLFDVTEQDFDVQTNQHLDGDTRTSEGAEEIATNIAQSLGVQGNYYAFSGAAQVNLEKYNQNKVQTVQTTKMIKARKYTVTARAFDMASKLSAGARDVFRQWSVERIVDTMGEFFATSVELGGEFRSTHVMEKRQRDTKSSLEHQLNLEYGKALVGSIKASSEGSLSESALQSQAKMRTTWQVWGGDSRVWLSLAENNLDQIQKQWADTVDDNNLYPIGIRLKPIWELVESIDLTKASQLKEYLLQRWGDSVRNLPVYLPAGVTENAASKRRQGFEQVWDMAAGACWHAANNHAGFDDHTMGDLERRDVAYQRMRSNFRGDSRLTGFADSMKWVAQDYGWFCNNELRGNDDLASNDRTKFILSRGRAMNSLGHDDLYWELEGMVREYCWAAAHGRFLDSEQTFAKAVLHKEEVNQILSDINAARAWPLY